MQAGHLDATTEISKQQVEEQLERILASRDFRASDKLSAFLRFVVEETLAGRSDRIKGYTVATEVFGRPADFDPACGPGRSHPGRTASPPARYLLPYGRRR